MHNLSRVIALAVAGLLVALTGSATLARGSPARQPATQQIGWQIFGAARAMPGLFRPTGVVVTSTGELYIADTGNNRIVRLSPTGRVLAAWPVLLLAHPENYPFGPVPVRLAVNRQNDVLVADGQHNQILEYSPQGRLLVRWAGGFSQPSGVAVGGHGNVLVADTGNHRIVKLAPTGKILGIWRPHETYGPYSVAIDRLGNVYASFQIDASGSSDAGSGTGGPALTDCVIEKYSPSGRDLGPLQRTGCGTELDEQDTSLAVDSADNLYAVTPACGGLVAKRSADGHWAVWGGGGVARGQFDDPTSVSVDRSGNVYIADAWNDRIQQLSPSGKPLAQWGTAGADPGWFASPEGVAVDSHGDVYVNDGRDNRIQELSPDGKPLQQWTKPSPAVANTLPVNPFMCQAGRVWDQGQEGVAVDGDGNVYAADTDANTVAAFSKGGALLATWAPSSGLGAPGLPDGVTAGISGLPYGVAVGPTGTVYMSDNDGSEVVRLSITLQPLGQWPIPATGLAVDHAGNIYAVDTFNERVRKLAPDGTVLAVWGRKGVAAGEYDLPRGIAIDAQGNIYVADTGNDRIQELSPQGKPLAQWGSMGSGVGRFHLPTAVAVDGQGNMYVADSGNDRVQRFHPAGPPTVPGSTPSPGSIQIATSTAPSRTRPRQKIGR